MKRVFEKVRQKKEDKKMEAVLKKQLFSDFIKKKDDVIRKMVEENTVKNKDGKTVVTKDDPWRKETEWDIYKSK